MLSDPQFQSTVQQNNQPSVDSDAVFEGTRLENVFYLDINTNSPRQVGPVSTGMPVENFRKKVCKSQCVDANFVRLLHNGKQLEDVRNGKVQTLKDYNFQNVRTSFLALDC